MGSAAGPVLGTERLILRRWSAADRAPFATINADPDVMRYFVAPSAASRDALIDRLEAQFEERGFGIWAVERRADAAFLGFAGLSVQELGTLALAHVEVGWRLAPSAWGQGYATEAGRAALRYGFEEVHLPEIVSFTSPLNVRSRRVMERVGMHHDPADDFDNARIPAGHPLRRQVLYRLTSEEFHAALRAQAQSSESCALPLPSPTGAGTVRTALRRAAPSRPYTATWRTGQLAGAHVRQHGWWRRTQPPGDFVMDAGR